MSIESLSTTSSPGYYAAVIKDLRAKRDELDRIIAALEKMACLPTSPVGLQPYAPPLPPSAPPAGIGEACVRILRRSRSSLTTREIAEALSAEGFQIKSDNPVNNVGSALNHRAKSARDVERDGPRHWRIVGEQEKSADTSETIRETANQMNGAEAH